MLERLIKLVLSPLPMLTIIFRLPQVLLLLGLLPRLEVSWTQRVL